MMLIALPLWYQMIDAIFVDQLLEFKWSSENCNCLPIKHSNRERDK